MILVGLKTDIRFPALKFAGGPYHHYVCSECDYFNFLFKQAYHNVNHLGYK